MFVEILSPTATASGTQGESGRDSPSPERSDAHGMELRGRKRVPSPDGHSSSKSNKKQKGANSEAVTRKKPLRRSGMFL